jgi:uncharacterized protein YdaT
MLKEILVVSGKPGLYKLISRAKNMLIIESLADEKRIPAYSRDKVMSLNDISIYTDDEEKPVGEIFTAIKEKEGGKATVSIDIAKAKPDEIRAYLAELVPNYDREKVYPTDIKKLLKWYELLMAKGITDFAKKEEPKEETAAVEENSTENAEAEAGAEADKPAAAKIGTSKAKSTSSKRKDTSLTAVSKSSAKVKSTPKAVTPKKSTVGAKRGG